MHVQADSLNMFADTQICRLPALVLWFGNQCAIRAVQYALGRLRV